MAVRPTGDPTKIMGLKKPVFWGIIGAGVVLFAYLWYRSHNSANNAAAAGPTDSSQGLTAADIGGTPADNSFATQTDQTALEEQIQQMQDALFQLQNSNGGNGAGLPGGNPGGHTGGTSTGTGVGSLPEVPPSPITSPVGSGNTAPVDGVRYFYNPPTQPVLSQNQTAVHPVTMS
jgi:hypothetical protein